MDTSDDNDVTARAGLPLIVEALRAVHLDEELDDRLHFGRCDRVYSSSEKVEALVLLLAAGGDRIEDIRTLSEDRGLLRLLDRQLPSPDTLLDFLSAFDDPDARAARRADEDAFVPKESAPLRALGEILDLSVERIADATADTATIDHDGTIIESHKRDAQVAYEGTRASRALSPMLMLTTGIVACAGEPSMSEVGQIYGQSLVDERLMSPLMRDHLAMRTLRLVAVASLLYGCSNPDGMLPSRTCSVSYTCVSQKCPAQFEGDQQITAVAVIDSEVFWLTSAGLWMRPSASESASAVQLTEHFGQGGNVMVATPLAVYYIVDERLRRYDRTTGLVATLDERLIAPVGIAKDAQSVYVTALGGPVREWPDVSGDPGAVSIVLGTESIATQAIAVNGAELFFVSAGNIVALSLATGASRIVADGVQPATIEADQDFIVWEYANNIERMSVTGGTRTTVVERTSVNSIALANGAIYWLSQWNQELTLGRDTDEIATGVDYGYGLTIATSGLWWVGGVWEGTALPCAIVHLEL